MAIGGSFNFLNMFASLLNLNDGQEKPKVKFGTAPEHQGRNRRHGHFTQKLRREMSPAKRKKARKKSYRSRMRNRQIAMGA